MLLRWGEISTRGQQLFQLFLFASDYANYISEQAPLEVRSKRLWVFVFFRILLRLLNIMRYNLWGKKYINKINPHPLKWAAASLKQGKSLWRQLPEISAVCCRQQYVLCYFGWNKELQAAGYLWASPLYSGWRCTSTLTLFLRGWFMPTASTIRPWKLLLFFCLKHWYQFV